MVTEAIRVDYAGQTIGAVSFDANKGVGAFQYANDFINTGIELSPIKMPLAKRIYSFPNLNEATFKGMPGLIADSLPDDFGNAVLNSWLASQGQQASQITPLQRLQYIGKRGMGALEFSPATQLKQLNASRQMAIADLVTMAQELLTQRQQFSVGLSAGGVADQQAMLALLSVGTSAGGARPKAILAFNQDLTQVKSGQTDIPAGYTHYLLKFDGVSDQRQTQETFGDPLGYGAMEYVYALMARACDIDMMPCKLLEEGHRRHFMTQRFDRKHNQKIHVQTLNGLAHVDFKSPGSFSYAQLFALARQLKLPATDAEQLFRRMVFNIVARNHDDHSKNVAFSLSSAHRWQLAPAYDLAYNYKPGGPWVNSHWLSLNGKRDDFTRADFYSLEKLSPLFSRRWINHIIDQTLEQVSYWRRLALEHQVPKFLIDEVESNLRLYL